MTDRDRLRLDPDPLTVEPEPVRRACVSCGQLLGTGQVVRCDDCIGRGPLSAGVWVVALAVVVLATVIAILALIATPRAAAIPTTPVPRDMSGLLEDASGSPLPSVPSSSTGGTESSPAVGSVPARMAVASALPEPGSTVYRGTATWFCSDGRDGSPRSACPAGYGPDDLVAAIDRKDSEFRKGDRVVVRFRDRAVVVTIVDVCRCVDARVIDLTIGAFERLAPWGLGVLPVTLEAADAIRLPETDGQETP